MATTELKAVITADDRASLAIQKFSDGVDKFADKASKASGKATSSFKSFASDASDSLNRFTGSISNVASKVALIGAASGVGFGSFITNGFEATRQVQKFVAGIDSLAGSSEEAGRLIKDMVDFVQGKPFDRIEVLGATRQLLTYGRTAEQVRSDIELLGRAVVVSGADWQSLSGIYGRVASANRLMTEEFNMLMDRGVNVGKSLTQNLGVSMEQLRKKLEDGEITFEDFRKAMEGALPADAVAKNSNTIDNKVKSLQASFRNLAFSMLGVDFSKLDANGQPLVKPGGLLDRLSNLMDNLSAKLKEPAIKQTFEKLGTQLANMAEKGIPKVLAFLQWLANNLGTVTAAMTALAAAFVVAKVAAIAFSIAASANPLGLIVLAIAAVVAALVFLQLKFNIFGKMWDAVKIAANGIKEAFGTAFNWIVEKLTWLKDNFWEAIGSIIGFFATLPMKLPMLAAEAILKVVQALISVKWSDVFSGLWNAAKGAFDKVQNAFVAIWQYLHDLKWSDIFSGVARSIGNALLGMLEGAVKGALKGLPGSIENKFSLPRFASGVQNFSGGAAIVGERGPELAYLPRGTSVLPNDKTRQVLGSSPTISITIQAGAFMGSQQDARKYAMMIMGAYSDAMAAKGMRA